MKNVLTLAALATIMISPAFAATTATTTNSATTTAVSANPVSPTERQNIESVVHDYLLKNPQILVEAIQNLQRQQQEQTQNTIKNTQQFASKFADALFHDQQNPISGNSQGSITIVEFFDYQCPHCVNMFPVVEAIAKADPNVRVVYKEFPIRGPVSDFASRAALAANMQNKYLPFQHALIAYQKPLSPDVVLQIAATVGLDVNKLKTDMQSAAITQQINNNIELAKKLNLFGTPAFFIGKTTSKTAINYFPGGMSQQQLQTEITKVSQSS